MDGHLEPLLRELLGAELRAERRRQGRTLAQIARAAGISMQHLSDVERGRKDPSSEMLAAITGALGVRIPQLLRRVVEATVLPAADGSAARVMDLTGAPAAAGHGPGRSAVSPSAGTVSLLAAA